MPSIVGSPVQSLAGFQSEPRATLYPAFCDPLPLGVRLFSIVSAGDQWVTRWVDDIEFRSVVPGGFASATITLRIPQHMSALPHPDPLGFSRLTELFSRIQIVDLRSQEIAWEGRVEDPARQVEPDTWQIGALGSMVAASDVSRPVFYVDSSLDRWVSAEQILSDGSLNNADQLGWWSTEKNDTTRTLLTTYNPLSLDDATNQIDYSWRWDSHGFDQAIARFTTTHSGIGPNATQQPHCRVTIGVASNQQIDVTTFGSPQTKTNTIGNDFTDQNTRYIVVGAVYDSGVYTITSSDFMQTKVSNPVIVGMRRDRYGNKLTTAASYTTYVTVAQVVEDVVGRYLAGGWYELALNTPQPGSVRPTDVYIDASNTTHILHLLYDQGATAADILNDLVSQVQTNAYWAIWESAWKATTPATAGTNAGFRFEWTAWPANWGYLATSQDGFEGQPNGDAVVNFVSQRYQDTGDENVWHVNTAWVTGNAMAPELLDGGFTRSVTLNKTDPTDSTTADNLASAYLANNSKVLNAGTLTVKRPIQLYDTGDTSSAGAGRMLDPWMIRPGKLIRIADLPPRGGTLDMAHGDAAPNPALNGTVFRVVATNYNSADNSCQLELDQVARWAVPTQIKVGAPVLNPVRIQ